MTSELSVLTNRSARADGRSAQLWYARHVTLNTVHLTVESLADNFKEKNDDFDFDQLRYVDNNIRYHLDAYEADSQPTNNKPCVHYSQCRRSVLYKKMTFQNSVYGYGVQGCVSFRAIPGPSLWCRPHIFTRVSVASFLVFQLPVVCISVMSSSHAIVEAYLVQLGFATILFTLSLLYAWQAAWRVYTHSNEWHRLNRTTPASIALFNLTLLSIMIITNGVRTNVAIAALVEVAGVLLVNNYQTRVHEVLELSFIDEAALNRMQMRDATVKDSGPEPHDEDDV